MNPTHRSAPGAGLPRGWLSRACMILILAAALAPVAAAGNADLPTSAPAAPQAARLHAAYGQLPLLFVENRGQTDPQVAFTTQAGGATVFFTPTGVTYALVESPPDADALASARHRPGAPARAAASPAPSRRWAIKLDFIGANPNVRPHGEEPAETIVSYFRGRPDQWHTGLRTFGRIVYPDLWPGVDLVYYGAGGALKYEFVVRPGADPRQIRLAYRGAEGVTINAAGQLAVRTPAGDLMDDVPVAWQDGLAGRTPVEVDYAFADTVSQLPTSSNQPSAANFGFQIGPYDRTRTLILDPTVFFYCGYIGGAEYDGARDVAVDAAGNAYITGVTTSTQVSFPVHGGPDLTFNGTADVFVVKIGAGGTSLTYAGYIGGAGDDSGHGIAVDAAGNAYILGDTSSDQTTFPVTVGPDLTYSGGNTDAFVAKINPSGTALIYAGYIGGGGEEESSRISTDDAGNAYVTGTTSSDQTTFPVSGGPDLTFNGGRDAFVVKINQVGTALVYAGYVGGIEGDSGHGIAVDGAGNAYIVGETFSDQASFPVKGGPDVTYNGGGDAFVAKLDSTGALTYAGYIGGDTLDSGHDIAVDEDGNAYVTGTTYSDQDSFPVLGGPDLTYNGVGWGDAFVAKVSPDGSNLLYAGYIGGDSADAGYGIAVDAAGSAYITGGTTSDQASFPVRDGPDVTYNGSVSGWGDAFIAKVDPSGTMLIYAGYIGGASDESGTGIAVDIMNNAYVTGTTDSNQATFPVVGGPDLTYNGGYRDAFIVKVGQRQPLSPVLWLPLVLR